MTPAQPVGSKREFRQAARRRRAELAASVDRASAGSAVAEAVLRFVPERDEERLRIAVYESLPDEPPTGPLIEALLSAGHEVIVPIVLDDFSLEWTYAAEGTTGDQATVTRLPKDATSSADGRLWLGVDALRGCDLIVTPGLSVDSHGTRIGQGGGCYDRALRHRDAWTLVVTLLHEGEQSDAELPRETHDAIVDGYVTTSGRVVRTAPPQPFGT
ncbi:MAG TPA: 5-formyltetrahydrofolate cyclo-ligase [Intrasporangium sp.]|uniref:5-formyltetrahydrofolate cyclo-ligase n=1 Tax=Intrasporangium sp. TaxID=1925024 RepID=UPI002B45C957|nr:5-formyltetrahydrofolate cyclo-ligase [Intrasporangium sp.]HKX68211.1 5-formyltetrahydrofolate cyclo-ligase [Intrasporangium sp.]